MIFRVLDIETIPDLPAWTPGEPSYRLVPNIFSPNIFSPGIGGLSNPTLEPAPTFPPPHAHRVVAISFVDVTFDPAHNPKYRFRTGYTECVWSRDHSELDKCEHYLLEKFANLMREDAIHLVTWNGRTFDLPVLALRSFKHRIAAPWYYSNKDVRYRYSTEGHCDLMDFLSDFGGAKSMKLHDAARLWGLPGKTDMSGAQISDIYESTVRDPTSDLTSIQASVARYCLQDSIQTALLFIASRYLIGKVTAEAYNDILKTFSDSPSVRAAIFLDWDRLRIEN